MLQVSDEPLPADLVRFDGESCLAPAFHIMEVAIPVGSSAVTYSDTITRDGLQWRLKVYPRGNEMAMPGFVSVFLECLESYPNQPAANCQYRLELVRSLRAAAKCSPTHSSAAFKRPHVAHCAVIYIALCGRRLLGFKPASTD